MSVVKTSYEIKYYYYLNNRSSGPFEFQVDALSDLVSKNDKFDEVRVDEVKEYIPGIDTFLLLDSMFISLDETDLSEDIIDELDKSIKDNLITYLNNKVDRFNKTVLRNFIDYCGVDLSVHGTTIMTIDEVIHYLEPFCYAANGFSVSRGDIVHLVNDPTPRKIFDYGTYSDSSDNDRFYISTCDRNGELKEVYSSDELIFMYHRGTFDLNDLK